MKGRTHRRRLVRAVAADEARWLVLALLLGLSGCQSCLDDEPRPPPEPPSRNVRLGQGISASRGPANQSLQGFRARQLQDAAALDDASEDAASE